MLEGAEVRLAVDIGGTFTDIVLDLGQDRRTRKVLTTPTRPEQAVLDGMRLILADARAHICDIDVFIHGTSRTVALPRVPVRRAAEHSLISGSVDAAVMLVSNLHDRGSIRSHLLLRSQRRLWTCANHPLLHKASVQFSDLRRRSDGSRIGGAG